MTEKLQLRQDYTDAAQALRQQLLADPDTLIYECTQYDENALRLAKRWAEEYLHE
jgi:S-ribosylhomocysteine lyase LuxS involved in autoinducer biosynthesis